MNRETEHESIRFRTGQGNSQRTSETRSSYGVGGGQNKKHVESRSRETNFVKYGLILRILLNQAFLQHTDFLTYLHASQTYQKSFLLFGKL